MKYTLTVSIGELNEASYEITYSPNDDAETAKVLTKLPDYFGEPLSFMSDAVSWSLIDLVVANMHRLVSSIGKSPKRSTVKSDASHMIT